MDVQKDTIVTKSANARQTEAVNRICGPRGGFEERDCSTEAFCKAVGRRIRAERKAQNLTLRRLSELADISVSFLGDIEKGRSNPSLPRLVEIAQALGKHPAYFLEQAREESPCGSGLQVSLLQEETLVFGGLEEGHRSLLVKLVRQPDFLKLLELMEDYESWSGREKAELLSLLKTKKEYCES